MNGTDIVLEMVPSIKRASWSIQVRQQIYKGLLESLENQGWTGHEECRGLDPALDGLLGEE